MKIKEMSDLISNNPDLKGKANVAAIRAVYSVILSELEKEGTEKLVLKGLGRFIVKNNKNKEGKETKRITFTPAKPKASK